jgi:hypothetical protein
VAAIALALAGMDDRYPPRGSNIFLSFEKLFAGRINTHALLRNSKSTWPARKTTQLGNQITTPISQRVVVERATPTQVGF